MWFVQPRHESDTLAAGMSIHLTAEPDATLPGEPTDSLWYVLHTRSRQEVILSNELRLDGPWSTACCWWDGGAASRAGRRRCACRCWRSTCS